MASLRDTSTPPTVVFDLGGVLVDWDPRYLFRRLLADEGFEDPDVQVLRSYGIADLEMLASSALAELNLETLPAGALAAAEGRLVSAFIRGRKPSP